jgi:hypothetical protein
MGRLNFSGTRVTVFPFTMTRVPDFQCSTPAFQMGSDCQAVNGSAAHSSRRFRERFQYVLWAKADTHENLILDYVAIARLLALPEQYQQDQLLIVEAVKRYGTLF